MLFACKATLISPVSFEEFSVRKDHCIVVRDGIIETVAAKLPEEYKDIPVRDYGDALLIPAFSDLHIHAPQYVQRGVGMDKLLFDWLNDYTFPQEAGFRDITYARAVYPQLIRDMLKHGTFHAAFFTTIHYDACDLFYRMLGESGMYAYTGKINMDSNSPDYYVEDPEESIAETERFLAEHDGLYGEHVRSILIPRFAPTCSEKLLKGLGELAGKYDVGVHTHVVESKAEAAWSRELFPQYASDSDIYEQCGLLQGKGPKIFAHVIFPTKDDERVLKKYNCVSVHCPISTNNITAGIMAVKKMQNEGFRIALGSDVGGGHRFGIYDVMANAVQSSKLRAFYLDDDSRLSLANTFYLATAAGGNVFAENIGKLEKGYRFNALVLDGLQDEGHELTPVETLERFCYCGDDRNITARYLDGKEIDPEEIYTRLKRL
ncbi:MAG: amidohydrolase family protein [Erysipelotrichaceae bacterium]|nr:amidohydrolase family protein [Erysipelotrichaceae bacterium]